MVKTIKKLYESVILKESKYTRYASTDEQEEAIADIEKWAKATGKGIVGGTTVGKAPQTVILDLTYQGGEIRVNSDGEIRVNGEFVQDDVDFEQAIGEGDNDDRGFDNWKIGDLVKIPSDLTNDPIKKQGEVGRIIKKTANNEEFKVEFKDGVTGWYLDSALERIEKESIKTESIDPLFSSLRDDDAYEIIKDAKDEADSNKTSDWLEYISEEYPEVTLDQIRNKYNDLQEKKYVFDSYDFNEGDRVDFGSYGRLYVVKRDAGLVSEGKLWVTDSEEDRVNPNASGWYIDESYAKRVVDEYDGQYDDENYDEEEDQDEEENEKESLKEGSYDDFRDNYNEELRDAVNNMKEGQKLTKIFLKDASEAEIDKMINKIEQSLSQYDKKVVDWILENFDSEKRVYEDDIARKAMDNMNQYGTEPQMIIYAIEEALQVVKNLTSEEEQEDQDMYGRKSEPEKEAMEPTQRRAGTPGRQKLNDVSLSMFNSPFSKLSYAQKDEVMSAMDKTMTESLDEVDSVTMNVPLLIRLFEYFNESNVEDKQLHDVVEKIINESKEKSPLTMDVYDKVINTTPEIETESLKKSTFRDVLADEEGKKIVEDLESILSSLDGKPDDKSLIEMRDRLIKQLKDKFGYKYILESKQTDFNKIKAEFDKAKIKDPKMMQKIANEVSKISGIGKKEAVDSKGVEIQIGSELHKGKYHVTVFGGKGFNRNGNLEQQRDYYKSFDNEIDANKYVNELKQKFKVHEEESVKMREFGPLYSPKNAPEKQSEKYLFVLKIGKYDALGGKYSRKVDEYIPEGKQYITDIDEDDLGVLYQDLKDIAKEEGKDFRDIEKMEESINSDFKKYKGYNYYQLNNKWVVKSYAKDFEDKTFNTEQEVKNFIDNFLGVKKEESCKSKK